MISTRPGLHSSHHSSLQHPRPRPISRLLPNSTPSLPSTFLTTTHRSTSCLAIRVSCPRPGNALAKPMPWSPPRHCRSTARSAVDYRSHCGNQWRCSWSRFHTNHRLSCIRKATDNFLDTQAMFQVSHWKPPQRQSSKLDQDLDYILSHLASLKLNFLGSIHPSLERFGRF